MREFKFRAWEGKKMYYQVRCGGVFDDMATAPTTWANTFWANLTGGEYTEVMQYTGLKDSNGKEIYEGDIIEDNQGLHYKIEYVESFGGFALYHYPADYHISVYELFMERSDYYEWEIIGNIYENPELL